MPTSLLLDCLDVVLLSMTDIINGSLVSGVFPSFYKYVIVKPVLKKSIIDPNDMKSYRRYNLFNGFQSAYSLDHSTETALLKVVHDLLSAWNEDNFSVLVLLGLSVTFDTVDHDMLLNFLHHVCLVSRTKLCHGSVLV